MLLVDPCHPLPHPPSLPPWTYRTPLPPSHPVSTLAVQVPCDIAAALCLLPGSDHVWASVAVPSTAPEFPGVTLSQWDVVSQDVPTSAPEGPLPGSASSEDSGAVTTTCSVCGCDYCFIPGAGAGAGAGGPTSESGAPDGGDNGGPPAPVVDVAADPDFAACPVVSPPPPFLPVPRRSSSPAPRRSSEGAFHY